MGDEGWEARMAARARERALVRQVEEMLEDPHRLHHSHLQGTSTYCSCGEFTGVTSIVLDDNYDPATQSCDRCGQRGVVRIGR